MKLNSTICIVIVLAMLDTITSCDKVCQHPSIKQMVINNYIDSNCTSVIIKRFDSGSNFTKLVDSSIQIISSSTVSYVFSDIYDYLVLLYPVNKVCKIKNIKFATDLGPGSSSTPCYSTFSYTVNDSIIWNNG